MFMSFTTHEQNLVCSYSDWWSWLWCQRVLICNGQRVWTALTFCSWLWTWSGPGGWAGFSDNPGSRPKPDRPRKTPWTLQSYNSSYRFLSCCRKYIHCRVFSVMQSILASRFRSPETHPHPSVFSCIVRESSGWQHLQVRQQLQSWTCSPTGCSIFPSVCRLVLIFDETSHCSGICSDIR